MTTSLHTIRGTITNVYYIECVELLTCAGEVDTCYNDCLHYIGIHIQLLSIVPAASNLITFYGFKVQVYKVFYITQKKG